MAQTGVPSLFQRDAMTYRAQLNPLAGLSMPRVAGMMSMAEKGYYPDLMWLYRFVEKRDATLRAVKHRRLGALKKLDWEIKVKAGVDEKAAKDQQEFLQEWYGNIDNIKEAVDHLSLADYRGFSHLEKHYDANGNVFHLEPVPQWYWVRRYPSRNWLYNAKSMQIAIGVEIDPDNFIVREIDDPIDEIATIAFMRKNLSQKDWDGFIETFGIPPIFIELPLGVGPSDHYQQMAEKVISDGRGVIGQGAKIVPLETGQRGVSPFKAHLDYQDQQIVMAATSGVLTQMTAQTGLGSGGAGQADAHTDAFYDIAKGEAIEISEVFQRQIDAALLKEKFPKQKPMVYFELAFSEVDDEQGPQVITDAVQLQQIGYKIDQDQLEEKTGYKLEEAPMPMAGGESDPNAAGGEEQDPADPYAAYGDWSSAIRNQKAFRHALGDAHQKFVGAIMHVVKSGDSTIVRELESMLNAVPDGLAED